MLTTPYNPIDDIQSAIKHINEAIIRLDNVKESTSLSDADQQEIESAIEYLKSAYSVLK